MVKNEYYKLKRRLQNIMRDEVIRKYKKKQPVTDIKRQLGKEYVEIEVQKPLQVYAFKERLLAIESFFTFATAFSKDECA